MLYEELEVYVPKEEFDFIRMITEQSIYFNETYPNFRLNSVGVIEEDFDVDTFLVRVTFEYEDHLDNL
jgi:hypothetical protein